MVNFFVVVFFVVPVWFFAGEFFVGIFFVGNILRIRHFFAYGTILRQRVLQRTNPRLLNYESSYGKYENRVLVKNFSSEIFSNEDSSTKKIPVENFLAKKVLAMNFGLKNFSKEFFLIKDSSFICTEIEECSVEKNSEEELFGKEFSTKNLLMNNFPAKIASKRRINYHKKYC
jgi:hypothetical protein